MYLYVCDLIPRCPELRSVRSRMSRMVPSTNVFTEWWASQLRSRESPWELRMSLLFGASAMFCRAPVLERLRESKRGVCR
ncbi:hypothetical protein N431DRAFT_120253 [Stipitochalara longipes BDJ]|nr:hypothetical protein N431DRAFT_120253 [Stipitochalara longipes BDJ]